ncbi:MAG: YtxH domain-containing protein [Armatimonadota bacterium]|jgi:gas vesicle protein
MSGRFWLGILVGAAAGAATALLYAPKTGEELRHDIGTMAKDTGKKAGATWENIKSGASETAKKAQEKARQAAGTAQEKVQQAAKKGGSVTSTWRSRAKEAVEAGKEAAEAKRLQMEAELKEREAKAS